MPRVAMTDENRASAGMGFLELPAKGERLRAALLWDENIKGRRHFIQVPEEDRVTTVACLLDYGFENCPACQYATGTFNTPVGTVQTRYCVPVAVFDQASKENGRPLKVVVNDDNQYAGEYSLKFWEFGRGEYWNSITDHREDVGSLLGAEIVIETSNPKNKAITLGFPRQQFCNVDDLSNILAELEELGDERIEARAVGNRVSQEEMMELIENSGALSGTEDDDDATAPWDREDDETA